MDRRASKTEVSWDEVVTAQDQVAQAATPAGDVPDRPPSTAAPPPSTEAGAGGGAGAEAEPSGPVDADAPGAARMQVIDQQIGQRISRLAGWLQTQLAESAESRRAELDDVRSDLAATTRALAETQDQLRTRLEQMAERAAGTAAGGVSGGPPAATDVARLDGLQQQIEQRTGRLRELFESHEAATAERLHAEIDALRSELLGTDGAPALAHIDERLDEVIERAEAAARKAARAAVVEAGAGRPPAGGNVAGSGMSRTTEVIDQRLGAVDDLRAELQVTRRELALMAERAAAEAAAATAAVTSSAEAEAARVEAMEQRSVARMRRLGRFVDAKLEEATVARVAEVAELQATMGGKLAQVRVTELDDDRLAALDRLLGQRVDSLADRVKSQLESLAARARSDTEALRTELQAALGRELGDQVAKARAEIGSTVASAHSRFVRGHDEMAERLAALAGQVAAVGEPPWRSALEAKLVAATDERVDARLQHVVERAEAVAKTAAVATGEADIGWMKALERRVGDSMGRLAETVERRLAESLAEREAVVEASRTELQAALAAVGRRVDALVADHEALEVAGLRAEMEAATSRASELEREVRATRDRVAELVKAANAAPAAVTAQIDALRSELTGKAADAAKSARSQVKALAGDVAALRSDLHALGEKVAASHSDLASTVAAVAVVAERSDRSAGRHARELEALVDRTEAAQRAVSRAASARASGLAPLRSDVRRLQEEVSALGASLDRTRTRRKSAGGQTPAPAPPPAPPKKVTAAKRVASGPPVVKPAAKRAAKRAAKPSAKRAATATGATLAKRTQPKP